MQRCLVVANQTLGGERLVSAVQERVAAQECEFYVVVPATPLREQVLGGAAGSRPSPQERAVALAQQRLDRALEQIRAMGAVADGEVGEADALKATQLALARFAAQEVLVSTLPLGLSRWWRGDLPGRIERSARVPVTHLVDDTDPST